MKVDWIGLEDVLTVEVKRVAGRRGQVHSLGEETQRGKIGDSKGLYATLPSSTFY